MPLKVFFPFVLAAVLAVSSCSTVKVLEEGTTRLADNKIVLPRGYGDLSSSLQPYVKQKPNNYYIGTWNPFLYVYNWSNGKGGKWDSFVKKIGVEPVVFDSTLVAPSCASIVKRLEYLGYYGSTVCDSITEKGRKTTVHYNVAPGRTYPVRNVNYEIPDSAMRRILASDSGFLSGTTLSENYLDTRSEEISKFLRNNGYYGFSKNYFFFSADTAIAPGYADLTVRINDYTRNESPEYGSPHEIFHIRNVKIVPSSGLKVRRDLFNDINRLKPGDLYRENDVNNTYERFASVGLFSGVNVQLQEVDSAMVDCSITLSPAKIQSVKFNFESSFNSNGLFGVAPSLSYSHRNLFHGGEVLTLGFRGNFQFKFTDKDARANELALSTSLSFPKFLLLPQSLFNTTLPRTEFSGVFNYSARPEYSRSMFSSSYGYKWRLYKKYLFQINPVQFSAVRMNRIDSLFYAEITDPYLKNAYKSHFDLGSGGSFYYTTSNSPNVSCFYTRVQLDLAGNILHQFDRMLKKNAAGESLVWGMPYSQYVRGEVQSVYTYRPERFSRLSFAARLLAGAGYAYGNSTSLPFEKFFYAGGANSLRGWQARTVGPGGAPRDTSFTIANQTGDMHLEANAEFRFPMFWKVNGAVFVDAGNIWNIGRKSDSATDADGNAGKDAVAERDPRGVFTFKNMFRTTALCYGFGFRLDFGIILVRFDMGVKAYDPRTQLWWFNENADLSNVGSYHFAIGYPF